jgi:hypothetical protein
VEIEDAGSAVDGMARGINEWGWGGGLWPHDPPNPGVARAELQLISLGEDIERNLSEIDGLLNDPRFSDPSNRQLASTKEALLQIAGRQREMMDLIFDVAYAPFPEYLTYYPDAIQEEIREMMRRAPRSSFTNMFASLAVIANTNIAQTRLLESVAANQIVAVARSCR